MDTLLPFLSVAPNPYLPNLPPLLTKYLLVVDPVQFFCLGINNYSTKNHKKQNRLPQNHYQSFRPFREHFLSEMQQYYRESMPLVNLPAA